MTATPDRTQLLDVNGTTIRVWDWGDPADPPIICVHGAFDHGRMFDDLAPRLVALGYHVLAIDQRGHGDSGRVRTGVTFEDSAIDIAAIAQRLGAPVGLLGHSLGASMCFSVAGSFPELVRWMISLDGLGPPPMAFELPPIAEMAVQGFDHAIRTFGRPARVFPSQADMAEQRGAINQRLPADWLDHLVEHGSRQVDDGWRWKWDPAFNTNVPSGFREANIWAEFEQVDVPTLVLTGGEDDMWSEMSGDEIGHRLTLLANAQHYAIPGAGHYLHLEQPDVVRTHIENFLAEVAP